MTVLGECLGQMVSANVYVQRVLVSLAGIQLLKATLENMLKIMNQQMGGKYRKILTFIMKEVNQCVHKRPAAAEDG